MKKYWTSPEYRRFNQKRAEASLRARVRHKGGKKLRNYEKNRRPKKYAFVKAPEHFSLIGNDEAVISFINTVRQHFYRRQPVWIVLRQVNKIDYDAIVVLLSIMVRFKAEGIKFNGDYPDDNESRRILEQSGFFKHLFRNFGDKEEYELAGKINFITHGAKDVRSELIADLILAAAEKVWGRQQRCPLVQTTLIELMQNTFGHADPGREGARHWWLSINYSEAENKLRFSFVDYGVGVFQSLARKTSGSRWYGVLERLFERVRYGNNADLMRLILAGELHKTVTEEYYRGQGLPGLLDAWEKNALTNLHILTNDVHAKVSLDDYNEIKVDFPGTFVYWEVTQENEHLGIET